METKRLYFVMLVNSAGSVLDVWMDRLEYSSDEAAHENFLNMANKICFDPTEGLDEGSKLIVEGEEAADGFKEEILIPADTAHYYKVDFSKILNQI